MSLAYELRMARNAQEVIDLLTGNDDRPGVSMPFEVALEIDGKLGAIPKMADDLHAERQFLFGAIEALRACSQAGRAPMSLGTTKRDPVLCLRRPKRSGAAERSSRSFAMNTFEPTRNERPAKMQRDDKDYAIEFGEYLAKAAERFMDSENAVEAARMLSDFGAEQDASADHSEAWRSLESAIYEFRKRAARAGHEPPAIDLNR